MTRGSFRLKLRHSKDPPNVLRLGGRVEDRVSNRLQSRIVALSFICRAVSLSACVYSTLEGTMNGWPQSECGDATLGIPMYKQRSREFQRDGTVILLQVRG